MAMTLTLEPKNKKNGNDLYVIYPMSDTKSDWIWT